jgi:DNA-binding XRE family transcriptional regulator
MFSPTHLRLAMAACDVTYADIAEEIGVVKPTVRNFAKGGNINSGTLVKIEKYFTDRGIIFIEAGHPAPEGGIGIRISSITASSESRA